MGSVNGVRFICPVGRVGRVRMRSVVSMTLQCRRCLDPFASK